jgi:hypothetical protein
VWLKLHSQRTQTAAILCGGRQATPADARTKSQAVCRQDDRERERINDHQTESKEDIVSDLGCTVGRHDAGACTDEDEFGMKIAEVRAGLS